MSLFIVIPAIARHDTAKVIEVTGPDAIKFVPWVLLERLEHVCHHLCAAGAMGSNLSDVGLQRVKEMSTHRHIS